jgi:EAL domain-containing protein (putative c-di-GMP-specific phosphodiesterase class I)
MLSDLSSRAITMAIIGLGRTLNVQVVAEGVETEEQASMLRAAACDELQGYLFARPMPAAEVAEWIVRSRSGAQSVAPEHVGATH